MQMIKFSASWCAPCKFLSESLKRYPHIRVMEIDIDSDPSAKANWGLRSVPTLVLIDETGEEKDRMIGFNSTKQLDDFIHRNVEAVGSEQYL